VEQTQQALQQAELKDIKWVATMSFALIHRLDTSSAHVSSLSAADRELNARIKDRVLEINDEDSSKLRTKELNKDPCPGLSRNRYLVLYAIAF